MPTQSAKPALSGRRRWTRQRWTIFLIAASLLWTIGAITVGSIAETIASASRVHNRARFTVPIVQTPSGYFVPDFDCESAHFLVQWWFPYRHHHSGWFDVAAGNGFVVIGSTEAAPPEGLRDPQLTRRTAYDWVHSSAPGYVPKPPAALMLRTTPEVIRILWIGLFLNGSILLVLIGGGATLLIAPPIVIPALRRRRRLRRGLCPFCTYDLSATPGPLCPECGGANPFAAP